MAGQGSLTWCPFSTALPCRLRSGGTSTLRQGAPSFTLTWSYGSYGHGPWEGTALSIRSFKWGCWKHTPVQNSHHKETVRPEMETVPLLVRTVTARPSELVQFSSVSAGAFLLGIISLHIEYLRADCSDIPCPSGWSVVGKKPTHHSFPPWHCEAEASTVHQGALSWNLEVVLEGLCSGPFEPVEEVPDKFFNLKTVSLPIIS